MDKKLLRLERLRSLALASSKLFLLLIFVNFTAFVFQTVLFLLFKSLAKLFMIDGILVGLLILSIIFKGRCQKRFRSYYKSLYVRPTLEKSFDSMVYDENKGFSKNQIKATGMIKFSWRTRYSSNDYLQGYYKAVKFERADVSVKKIIYFYRPYLRMSRIRSSVLTYFVGRWMIFDCKQNFSSNLIVVKKNFSFAEEDQSFSGTSFAKVLYSDNKRYQRPLILQDQGFSKLFDAYANDSQEANRILTREVRSFMTKLLPMLDGPVIFGFINNQLHIGIFNYVDSMEPSQNNKIIPSVEERTIQYEASLIKGIIDNMPTSLLQLDPTNQDILA